jgi:glutamyl-tRNA synthetase
MDYPALATLLFPDVTETPEDVLAKYPPRKLPEGAKVTRFAPSPTGFVHFGGLFPSMVDERLARQSGGVFYLRIEDTDSKREVKGAEEGILSAYADLGITFDEGPSFEGEKGAYGPYRQSRRRAIYRVFAKKLVAEGKAYPCFCSKEELDAARARQKALKLTPGYYGQWAKCRDLAFEQVKEKLEKGIPFVIRLRLEGREEGRVKFTDLVKGPIEFTENFIDHVMLKSSGMPDYHFAHAVDDTLMHTTHVVRGEEWLSSLPYHLQLFKALGFKPPKYLHIAQLMRLEGGAKKKLSKRDNSASLAYYIAAGYPKESVREYVMTLLNSNYEEWRRANPDLPLEDFPFSIKKMSPSGCLFDFDKLNDVSKNTIAHMSAGQVYDSLSAWAKRFDPGFYALLESDPQYAKNILSIGRGGRKPRKDLVTWKDAKPYMSFFYDELFEHSRDYPPNTLGDANAILDGFAKVYLPDDDSEKWFEKVKALAASLGYADDMKRYRANPEAFKGSVADVSMVLRIAVTGRQNAPDLCTVMRLLGERRVKERLERGKL